MVTSLIKQKGFTLFEILVAVIIIAVGLLGIASLQAAAVSATTASGMRGEAAISVSNLSSYMRSNKAYWDATVSGTSTSTITVSIIDSDVSISGDITNSSTDCSVDICSPEQLAVFDITNWAEYIDSRLVNPELTITKRSESVDLLSITLEWVEKPAGSILNTLDDNSDPGSNIKSYTVMVSL